MGKYNQIWANEVKHDHKWINMAKQVQSGQIRANMSKKGFSRNYLIDTFAGKW